MILMIITFFAYDFMLSEAKTKDFDAFRVPFNNEKIKANS